MIASKLSIGPTGDQGWEHVAMCGAGMRFADLMPDLFPSPLQLGRPGL